jgi:hypothetical protein
MYKCVLCASFGKKSYLLELFDFLKRRALLAPFVFVRFLLNLQCMDFHLIFLFLDDAIAIFNSG